MTRLVALAGVTAISFAAILVRLADTTPVTVTFFRGFFALPLLAVGWAATRRRDDRSRRSRLTAVAAGVILSVDLSAWHLAIDAIGPGPATVLANVQVVFVALIAWWAYRERPPRLTLILLPPILLGVALLAGLGDAASGERPWLGAGFGLAAAVTYAAFILLLRHSNRATLAPSVGPVLDATLGVVAGSSLLALFDSGFDMTPSWPTIGWLAALGVVAQVAGWLLITHALPRLPAAQVSAMILLQPALTLVWARFVFDEALTGVQWLGVAIVMAGIGAITSRRSSLESEPVDAAEI